MKNRMLAVLAAGSVLLAEPAVAQERGPNLTGQREAMQKLGFLAGKWVGEASVIRGPGEPLKIQQTEDVQFKLDGLVLLVEGTGRDPAGKIVFSALATVAYDEATQTYRFRSHSSGRYLETELKVTENGFEWGFTSGALTVKNTMRLDAQGDWSETTESKFGDSPPRRTVEIHVKKVK